MSRAVLRRSVLVVLVAAVAASVFAFSLRGDQATPAGTVAPDATPATVVPTPFVPAVRQATPATSEFTALPETPTTEDGIPFVRGHPRIVSFGPFEELDGMEPAHGQVFLVEVRPDEYVIRLENFRTDPAPGLSVYLSTEAHGRGEGSLRLGAVEGVDGDYTHAIPAGTAARTFRSVVIWSDATASLVAVAPFLY